MDLRQIEYFTQLYKDLNITKASRNLFISQQGLSKSLSKLEAEIGLPLFERSVQGVTPTTAANLLYQSFDKVAEAYHDLQTRIQHVKGRRMLHIGAPEFFSMCCDRDTFGKYELDHPEISIRYREMDIHQIEDDLISGSLDVGFMTSPVSDRLKIHDCISREPVYVVMHNSHRLARRKQIHMKDLNANVLLFLTSIPSINQRIQREADRLDLEYQVRDSVSASEFIMKIHGSLLLGIGSRKLFQYFDFPDIRYIPLKMDQGEPLYIEMNLVSAKGRAVSEEAQDYLDYWKRKKRNFD